MPKRHKKRPIYEKTIPNGLPQLETVEVLAMVDLGDIQQLTDNYHYSIRSPKLSRQYAGHYVTIKLPKTIILTAVEGIEPEAYDMTVTI